MTRAVALGLVLLAPLARAEPYAAGSVLPRLALQDQHGADGVVDDSVRLLLLSRDMTAGGTVKAALASADQYTLDARRAVYVADVSKMPAVITRLFALPGMRKRPYRILLDRDGSATRDLPSQAGRPTLLLLDALRVTRVLHPETTGELRAAIEEASREAGPLPGP